MSSTMEGRAALVTGGASGIGQEAAVLGVCAEWIAADAGAIVVEANPN